MTKVFDAKVEAAALATMCGAWPDGTYAEIIERALEAARAVGREAGEKAMRERAARVSEIEEGRLQQHASHAAAIRALKTGGGT